MPLPIALCIEDLEAPRPSERYLRCVAIAGAEPGLGLAPDGTIRWKQETPLACELWVSLDDRLILLRPAGAIEIRVSRAGRSLLAPEGKPVVLRNQDQLELGGRSFRVHVHGRAPTVHPPAWLEPAPAPRPEVHARAARTAAAALALGAALSMTACGDEELEVRHEPPKVAMPIDDPPDQEGTEGEGVTPPVEPPPVEPQPPELEDPGPPEQPQIPELEDPPPPVEPQPPELDKPETDETEPIKVLNTPPRMAAPPPPAPEPPPPSPEPPPDQLTDED